ncbi:MAG: cytochrome c1 [Betaproteobacteria bacterium]|nr:cytochrome c1 [Betaproteobacteria bacterium]
MKRLLLALVFAPSLAAAAEAGFPLDRSPSDPRDLVSLQSGARTFANYCEGCHGVQYLRYNRLEELGLNEGEIRDNLMFFADKVGETMKTVMPAKEAKTWFGVAPPDLSLVARSRGADWLYTYLRTFYRDSKTMTGWNNAVFPNVAMPHALWTLQGERALEVEEPKEGEGAGRPEYRWKELSKGTLTQVEYDALVRDLVNFLVYAGEPAATTRREIGIVALFVLGVVFIFAWLVKRNFWKDVK